MDFKKRLCDFTFEFELKVEGSSDLNSKEENSFDFRPEEGSRNNVIKLLFL